MLLAVNLLCRIVLSQSSTASVGFVCGGCAVSIQLFNCRITSSSCPLPFIGRSQKNQLIQGIDASVCFPDEKN